MTPFFQVTLRTTDVEASRTFYAAVLGASGLDIVKLHEQALARGARPHWLGFIDVGEVDAAAAAFVARGATPLGPKWVNPNGLEAVVLRDPGGAVVALAKPSKAGRATDALEGRVGPHVVWYGLNTADVDRARSNYSELFGWHFLTPVKLDGLGVFHPFAWEQSAHAVGSMTDIATRPGVHPHWLFHFRVPSLELAMNAVRAGGGIVAASFTLPGGDQLAVCDDPQGAAFAIREGRAPAT